MCLIMQAFQGAWADACKVEASSLIVPSGYEFLVGPISFSGPYCQRNILFQVYDTTQETLYFEKSTIFFLLYNKIRNKIYPSLRSKVLCIFMIL